MGNGQAAQPGMTWLAFALMTVVSWGVYGIFLHTGQLNMADMANGRAFTGSFETAGLPAHCAKPNAASATAKLMATATYVAKATSCTRSR